MGISQAPLRANLRSTDLILPVHSGPLPVFCISWPNGITLCPLGPSPNTSSPFSPMFKLSESLPFSYLSSMSVSFPTEVCGTRWLSLCLLKIDLYFVIFMMAVLEMTAWVSNGWKFSKVFLYRCRFFLTRLQALRVGTTMAGWFTALSATPSMASYTWWNLVQMWWIDSENTKKKKPWNLEVPPRRHPPLPPKGYINF